jgi:hypothetical protein
MKTPEETRVLAEIAAAKERGEDPFGDNDVNEVVEQVPVTESIPDPDQVVEKPETKTEEATIEVAQVPVEDAVQVEQVPPTVYQAVVPADYKAQRTELLKEKAGLMKKLMDGEIDPEEFATNEARISDSLDDLTAQRIRAETLQEANVQSQAQYQRKEIQKLIVKSKAEVDYATDAKAQKQFDMALQAVASDADNASLDYSEILAQAHKVVLALRGIATKGQVVEEAIKSRIPDVKVPVTLRSIPTAATPNANGNMLDQIGRLTGQAYQDAFAKLSPMQRRALLDEA